MSILQNVYTCTCLYDTQYTCIYILFFDHSLSLGTWTSSQTLPYPCPISLPSSMRRVPLTSPTLWLHTEHTPSSLKPSSLSFWLIHPGEPTHGTRWVWQVGVASTPHPLRLLSVSHAHVHALQTDNVPPHTCRCGCSGCSRLLCMHSLPLGFISDLWNVQYNYIHNVYAFRL